MTRASGDTVPDSRARALLLAVCIAGYPVAAALQAITGLNSRFFSVPYRALIAALAVWILTRALAAGWSGYTGTIWLPLGVFWLLYAWRLASDGLFDQVSLGVPLSDYLLIGLASSLLPMLACFTIRDAVTAEQARRLTLPMATIGAAAAIVLGLREIVQGNFLSVVTGRFGLQALNPISLGHLGATTALLWVERLLSAGPARSRPVAMAGVVLGVGVTALAGSRGPILALLACMGLMLVVAMRRGRLVRGTVLAVVVVSAASVSALIAQELGLGVIRRIEGVREDLSSIERVTILRDAWNQFLAHPILGSGLEEKVSSFYPHNPIVEAFMATGIVGGLAYLMVIVAGGYAGLRLVRAAGAGAWVGILLIQYLTGALLSGTVYSGTSAYPLLATAVALSSTLPSALAQSRAVAVPSSAPASG